MTETGFLAVQPQTQTSAMAEISKSKAVQEIQAALVIAKNFPRDVNAAYQRIIDACKRPFLAQKAMYAYPRGGQTITGPSIRLAEVLAQNYGNLDFGIRELDRRAGVSIVESYCWDMETNTRQTKTFEILHEIKTKQGTKTITDPRDIYELVANNGARRLRACILGIIPIDIVDAAVQQVQATIAKGDGKPLIDRARAMAAAFKEHFGVTLEMIEKRLGHRLDLITNDQFVELFSVFNSLKDRHAAKSEFFVMETPVKQMESSAEADEKRKVLDMVEKRISALLDTGRSIADVLKVVGTKTIEEINAMDSKKLLAVLDVLNEVKW